MRVVECDVCGETISAADDEELARRLKDHLSEEHDESPDDDTVSRRSTKRRTTRWIRDPSTALTRASSRAGHVPRGCVRNCSPYARVASTHSPPREPRIASAPRDERSRDLRRRRLRARGPAGGGGHQRRPVAWNLLGFLDDDPATHGGALLDLPVLGGDRLAGGHPSGRGRRGRGVAREPLEDAARARPREHPVLVHPRAWIANHVTIGRGTVVLAGAAISTEVSIGEFVCLNKNCIAGHEGVVGDFVTVSPGASLSGRVHIGTGCDIGANSVVVQGVRVGEWSVVGAGGVVPRDLRAERDRRGRPGQGDQGTPRRLARGLKGPVEASRCACCGTSAAPRATHDAHVPEARIAIACGPSHPRLHHIRRTDHASTNP